MSPASEAGRSLALFPADDPRFRRCALLAVELFAPSPERRGGPTTVGMWDDERMRAAAQAMLRAAYPLATILGDPRPRPDASDPAAAAWQVYRDAASLDDALVRAARSGHADAVTLLADRYQGIAFLVAWTICGEAAGAMTALGESMAQLFASDGHVGGADLADTLLRQTRRSALARRAASTAPRAVPQVEARARLSAKLARLPVPQATALHLAYVEGLSASEVALALDIDEDLARASIRAGLAALAAEPRWHHGGSASG